MATRNFIFYRGPSMLDGSPIIGVATVKSWNSKVGNSVQTFILRADMRPSDASRIGADVSICGNCPHRGTYKDGLRVSGSRSCYVMLFPVNAVYDSALAGKYEDLCESAEVIAERCAGRFVRLGAYGDPAAIPVWAWLPLLRGASGHAGYTHQWRAYPEFASWCMASCDSGEDRVAAKVLGFRTFRVAPRVGWQKEAGEVLCPASAEAGRKTVCAACKACGGVSAKAKADVVIPAHGMGRNMITGLAA